MTEHFKQMTVPGEKIIRRLAQIMLSNGKVGTGKCQMLFGGQFGYLMCCTDAQDVCDVRKWFLINLMVSTEASW